MEEIARRPDNGLLAASLFAGCGGTSLGYLMAGYRVVYANEWDAHARATYTSNFPGTALDPRDIRLVRGEDIVGCAGKELDVLDASPPCQSWSMAGRRRLLHDPNGEVFREFIRLVGEVKPRAFVAENVEGLAQGAAKPFLRDMVGELAACGYEVGVRTLIASWLGVPQTRRRVVMVGLRRDLGLLPDLAFPVPDKRETVIRDVLPDIRRLVRIDREPPHEELESWPARGPSPTIVAHGIGYWRRELVLAEEQNGLTRPIALDELKRLSSFPDDFRLEGSYAKCWTRLGNAVPPLMARSWAASVRDQLLVVG